MLGFFNKKKIELDEYKGIEFYPVHQLKKENSNQEPYYKTVQIGGLTQEFTFFKIKGNIFAIKPSSKNKHISKQVACRVSNPLTLRSAEGSITGNCAKGVKKEYIDYLGNLSRSGLSEEEIFLHVVSNIDNLK